MHPHLPPEDSPNERTGRSALEGVEAAIRQRCPNKLISALLRGGDLSRTNAAGRDLAVEILARHFRDCAGIPSSDGQNWIALEQHFLLLQSWPEVASRVVNWRRNEEMVPFLALLIEYGASDSLIEKVLELSPKLDCKFSIAAHNPVTGENVTARSSTFLHLALRMRHYRAAIRLLDCTSNILHADSLGNRTLDSLYSNGGPLSSDGLHLLQKLLQRGASAMDSGSSGIAAWELMLRCDDSEALRACAVYSLAGNHQEELREAYRNIADAVSGGMSGVELQCAFRSCGRDFWALAAFAQLQNHEALSAFERATAIERALPILVLPEQKEARGKLLSSLVPPLTLSSPQTCALFTTALLALGHHADEDSENVYRLPEIVTRRKSGSLSSTARNLLFDCGRLTHSFALWQSDTISVPNFSHEVVSVDKQPALLEEFGFVRYSLNSSSESRYLIYRPRYLEIKERLSIGTKRIHRIQGEWCIELGTDVASIWNESFGLLVVANSGSASARKAFPARCYWCPASGETAHSISIHNEYYGVSRNSTLIPFTQPSILDNALNVEYAGTLAAALSNTVNEIAYWRYDTRQTQDGLGGPTFTGAYSDGFSHLISRLEGFANISRVRKLPFPEISFVRSDATTLCAFPYDHPKRGEQKTLVVTPDVCSKLLDLGGGKAESARSSEFGLTNFFEQAGAAHSALLVWRLPGWERALGR